MSGRPYKTLMRERAGEGYDAIVAAYDLLMRINPASKARWAHQDVYEQLRDYIAAVREERPDIIHDEFEHETWGKWEA